MVVVAAEVAGDDEVGCVGKWALQCSRCYRTDID